MFVFLIVFYIYINYKLKILKMSNAKQKLPKWFKGQLYEDGDTVKNPFSGEECKLNNVELSMYDFLIGSQMVFEMSPQTATPESIKEFQKGLDWFKENNKEAYEILLD
tara:strand:+ start:105 stop:428 length:324 start_codon:yes stop_codon:yes gene_type:complete